MLAYTRCTLLMFNWDSSTWPSTSPSVLLLSYLTWHVTLSCKIWSGGEMHANVCSGWGCSVSFHDAGMSHVRAVCLLEGTAAVLIQLSPIHSYHTGLMTQEGLLCMGST